MKKLIKCHFCGKSKEESKMLYVMPLDSYYCGRKCFKKETEMLFNKGPLKGLEKWGLIKTQ